MASLAGSENTINLAVPRPFINKCYPLLEPHILKLFTISEG